VNVVAQEFQRLAERARSDPAFFHALVYNPQQAIAQMPDLPRELQARILAIDPETVVERLAGALRKYGIAGGDDSCERTCGMRSRDVTCASSPQEAAAWSGRTATSRWSGGRGGVMGRPVSRLPFFSCTV
jgi:hypothetical protein